jgi:hypothetical protein
MSVTELASDWLDGLLLGERQLALIKRAASSRYGYVMPGGYLERRALRRLERRGFAHPALGLPDVWRIF